MLAEAVAGAAKYVPAAQAGETAAAQPAAGAAFPKIPTVHVALNVPAAHGAHVMSALLFEGAA